MLTVWLYLLGAGTACAYALGASMAWLSPALPVAVAWLGVASAFVLSAELCSRRSRLRASGPRPPALAAAEHDDHSLIDGLDDIVFQTDRSAALSFLNRAWKTVTALDTGDCVGKAFFDYVHPDEQALNREQFLMILQQGAASCRFETRLIGRDGRACWVDVRLRPRRGRHGEVNGVTGIMTDIHSRKRAEEVLRARDRSLSTLLDHLPGMAFRCRNDRRWTMEFVSDGCFELTGYEAVELLDHLSYDQLIVSEDRAYVWDYVQSQLGQHKAFHLRYRIRARDGGEKWVEERSRGIFAGNGTLLAIEGFVSDVSEQHRDEERAAHESLHDPLTGLERRPLLLARVAAAIGAEAGSAPPPLALLCLDIDQLERINQRHGRAAGDQLLAALGARLARLGGAGVAVGRVGSDEFALAVHGCPALPDGRLAPLPELARFAGGLGEDARLCAAVACAIAWTEVLAAVLDEPFELERTAVSISAHLGIALGVDAPRDAEAMLRDAMQAAWSAQWHSPGSAVRYGFAGARALPAAQAWRHTAAEFGDKLDAARLEASIAAPAGAHWVEGGARWRGPRSGVLEGMPLLLHACMAGTLEALVADCVRVVGAAALPRLQAGERLAVRLDMLPPGIALRLGMRAALQLPQWQGGGARLVFVLALASSDDAAPSLAELEALRAAGVELAVDVTAALTPARAELPAWLLLADYWRIGLDPAAAEAERVARLLELAAGRGIAVVSGAPPGAAAGD